MSGTIRLAGITICDKCSKLANLSMEARYTDDHYTTPHCEICGEEGAGWYELSVIDIVRMMLKRIVKERV